MVLLNKYHGICSKAAYIEMVTCKKHGYHTFTIVKPTLIFIRDIIVYYHIYVYIA